MSSEKELESRKEDDSKSDSWGGEDEEDNEDEEDASAFMFQRTKPPSSFSDKIGNLDVLADIDPDGGK